MASNKKRTGHRQDTATSASGIPPILFGLAVAMLGVVAYCNALNGPFVFDDHEWITGGYRIRQPLWPPGPFFQNTSRPFFFYSLAVNYRVCGLAVVGYHVFNLTVHVGCGLLLFGLMRRVLVLTRSGSASTTSSNCVAFAVAAIWTVHPLQTQAVNYVIQRCETMMSFFLLLMLYCMVRAAGSSKRWIWYVGAVLACWAGTGCKEVMIVAPIVAVLFDRVFLAESWRELAKQRWLVYAAMLPATVWLLYVNAKGIERHLTSKPDRAAAAGTLESAVGQQSVVTERHAPTPRRQGELISPLEYARTQAGIVLRYLRLVVWPQPLCLDYQSWPVSSPREAVLPSLAIIVLLTLSVAALWYRPPWGFLAVSFFILLAPTSSFLPVEDLAFEHRMYLASAPVIALLVLSAYWLSKLVLNRTSWSQPARQAVPCGLLAVVIAVLSTTTLARNRDYQSDIALWSSVLDVFPGNVRAMNQLAEALLRDGRNEEAQSILLRALAIDPDNPWSLSALGRLALDNGHVQDALAMFEQAVTSAPNHAEMRVNLAVALGEAGRWAEAIPHLKRATRREPQLAAAHFTLGLALANTQRSDDALASYAKALRLDPNYYQAHANMAVLLAQMNEMDLALPHFEQAADLISDDNPDRIDALFNLAAAYANARRFDSALRTARNAAALAYRLGEQRRAEEIQRLIEAIGDGAPAANGTGNPP